MRKIKIKFFILVLTILTPFLLVGCVQQQPRETVEETPGAKHYFVSINRNGFEPNYLEINVGDSVSWTNKDAELMHAVEFVGDASEELKQGESWTKTFEQKGKYSYLEPVYGIGKGKIVVK